MLTATPRTVVSTKDVSFDDVWGQNSLVFLLCFVFSTFGAKWDFKNDMGLRKWDFKMGFQTLCQKKRQWARNTLAFVSSRYANAFLRYCILNVFFFCMLNPRPDEGGAQRAPPVGFSPITQIGLGIAL